MITYNFCCRLHDFRGEAPDTAPLCHVKVHWIFTTLPWVMSAAGNAFNRKIFGNFNASFVVVTFRRMAKKIIKGYGEYLSDFIRVFCPFVVRKPH